MLLSPPAMEIASTVLSSLAQAIARPLSSRQHSAAAAGEISTEEISIFRAIEACCGHLSQDGALRRDVSILLLCLFHPSSPQPSTRLSAIFAGHQSLEETQDTPTQDYATSAPPHSRRPTHAFTFAQSSTQATRCSSLARGRLDCRGGGYLPPRAGSARSVPGPSRLPTETIGKLQQQQVSTLAFGPTEASKVAAPR